MILRLGLLTVAFAACAGPNHEIVEDRFDLAETSSSPEVTEVVDVGGGDVVTSGNLGMQNPDGVAVIGETLWIRGRAFGRQPAVTVGGRPAAVLGRTRDGGIVVRVPPATPSGSQPVVVSNEVGRGERPIAVRRYAAVLAPGAGEIGWADVGTDGPIAAGATAVRGARWLALSSDGRAAYLAEASRSTVQVVEMPAPGGPKVVYRLDLGNDPIVALAAAGRAPMLAVVREKDVMLLDTSSPLRPARSTPRRASARDRASACRRRRPFARRQAARGRHGRRQPRRVARSRCRAGAPPWRASWRSSRTFARACWSTSRSRRRATRCGSCRATRRAAARADRNRPSCARCAWARARRA